MSFSYPPVKGPPVERIPIRPWLGFTPPPLSLLSNISVPSPPNPPRNNDHYTVSTHVVPGSYLRHSSMIPLPSPPSGQTKAQYMESAENIFNELSRVRMEAWQGKHPTMRQAVVWNCIKRYIPKRRKNCGVTLFFAHAIGFPKEIWEPTIQHLLDIDNVSEIWLWESIYDGDSGLLNREQESAVFDWVDNSNDMLSFLVHYLPSSANDAHLPTHLPRLPEAESETRLIRGFEGRILVPVAHSYGGCTVALSARRLPALFSSLVLVDPVITPYDPKLGRFGPNRWSDFVRAAILRKSEWSSRDKALRTFASNPFLADWDPDVLKAYVDYGLYRDNDSGKIEVYQLLEDIDESITMFWVMPGKPDTFHRVEGAAQALVWRRPQNSSNIVLPNAAHLIPHEAPRELAQALSSFLKQWYSGGGAKL